MRRRHEFWPTASASRAAALHARARALGIELLRDAQHVDREPRPAVGREQHAERPAERIDVEFAIRLRCKRSTQREIARGARAVKDKPSASRGGDSRSGVLRKSNSASNGKLRSR